MSTQTLVGCLDLAVSSFDKFVSILPLTNYRGILALLGMAHVACEAGDERLIEQVRLEILPFVRGEKDFPNNFPNYLCGGAAAAYLFAKGHLPEACDAVRKYAEEIRCHALRDRDGIVCHPQHPGEERIFIDVAYAIVPFLAYAGLAFDEPAYREDAIDQVEKMTRAFRDPANGLLHQSRGFPGPGIFSEDHWSRGNGWGLIALCEAFESLPATHPRRAIVGGLLADLVNSCLAFQDEDGVWHQELTRCDSYVETSGTGLILYALGVAISQGLLPDSSRAQFLKGLRGYLDYIDEDGTVRNTCASCLSPGRGTIADYMARPHIVNDSHAFGPVILAFGIAANRLNIPSIQPL